MSKTTKKSNPSRARAIQEGDLGGYLKLAREATGLSQGDVAQAVKMNQSQSLSQWERNSSGSIPMSSLRALVELYDLPMDEVYEVLLKYQTHRLETKLERQFFAKLPADRRRGKAG